MKVESKSVWHHQLVVRDSFLVALVCRNSVFTPTNRSNAQHLVEYEKQLLYEVNKSIFGECHATAYGLLRLWYKYKLRKCSQLDIFTFRAINTFMSNSGTPILREK